MRWLRHLGWLLMEMLRFGRASGRWTVFAILAVAALAVVAVLVAQVLAPAVLYPFA